MKVRNDLAQTLYLQTDHLVVPRRSVRSVHAAAPGRLRGMVATGAGLAAVWAGLHWDDPISWAIGLPTVLAGAGATALLPTAVAPRLSLAGALRLGAFAVAGVLRGAFDVSLLSLRPGRLNAGCLDFRTRLPEGRPRRLFALAITLLPGTLTARLSGDRLTVHALDCGPAVRADLTALENRIAGLFGLTLDGGPA